MCSSTLSELIRKEKLDEQTEKLKIYSIYEFVDGDKYVTHLIENKPVQKDYVFENKKENQSNIIKLLTANNDLFVTEQKRREGIVYLTRPRRFIKTTISDSGEIFSVPSTMSNFVELLDEIPRSSE